MQSTKSFIKLYAKKLPFGFIVLLLLFAGALAGFIFIVEEVLGEQEEQFDQYVFSLVSGITSDGVTGFMKTVTYFASSAFLRVAYVVVFLFYLIKKDVKRALEIAVIGAGGYLVNYIMKLSFQRERPDFPLIDPGPNFSFPSGHATSGFIFFGILVYLISKSTLPVYVKYITGSILIIFALLIGFSRIYLRVHFTTDVIAGFCTGVAWLCLTVFLMEKLKKKSDRELKTGVAPDYRNKADAGR